MTRKTYRTAMGKTVDLGALQLQNENIRAVGNMKVNARGDLIDGWNRPIDRRTQQVQKQYERQTSNVRDVAAPTTSTVPAPSVSTKPKQEIKQAPPTATPTATPTVASTEPVSNAVPPVTASVPEEEYPSEGLAAAIARARRVKQELIEPSNQAAQKKPGVTKI
jgi:hypothetical protein